MRLAWFETIEEWLISALLAVMTIVTFAQVIARYVFNYSFVWALELVTFLFAALIFLGMAYGVRVGAHIGVDALVKTLAPRTARTVSAIAALLCIAYSIIGFIGGSVYVAKMYDIGILAQDLPIQQWIPRLVLPIGFAILLARFVQLFYRIVSGREQGLHLADEAAEALKLNALGKGSTEKAERP
ncbi:MAG: TRAP transporter small permease [Casimicrobiaceae bacterium]